jgi:hypothetical protein
MMTPSGIHLRPLHPEEDPILKAMAQAARELRQETGKDPVFFSHPLKETPQNPEGETK